MVRPTARRGSTTPRMRKAWPLAIDAVSQLKFIPKKPERRDGQEDQRHERQAIDLLALFAGDLGREIVDDVRHPLPALEKLLLDVLHLVGVVVELRGPADSRALHRLDAGRRRANRTEIAIEARRCRLQPLKPLRQRDGIGRAGFAQGKPLSRFKSMTSKAEPSVPSRSCRRMPAAS